VVSVGPDRGEAGVGPELRGEHVVLVAAGADHVPELRRIVRTPEVRLRCDIFLEGVVHGRGHGRDAITRLARYLIDECGHHRLTIDPAADNERLSAATRRSVSGGSGSCGSTSVTSTGRAGTTAC
jgi:hypothetical protein